MGVNSFVSAFLVATVLGSSHAGLAFAQQKPVGKIVPKPGVLSGRVLAITNSGDIKPARMADVYLFYVARGALSSLDKEGHKEYESSVGGGQWMEQESKRLTEQIQWLTNNGVEASDSLKCREELLSYDKKVLRLLDWTKAENRSSQIVTGSTDEEGMIRMTVPHGMYRLLVRGRAGFNDALWQSDVLITSGKETDVKLSVPLQACLAVQ